MSKVKIGNYPIPFGWLSGNMLGYPENQFVPSAMDTGSSKVIRDNGSEKLVDPKWVENHIFEAEMEITGYGRGRSSVVFNLTDHSPRLDGGGHRSYEMFMTQFENMFRQVVIDHGKIVGIHKWTYVKTGQNYSLRFLE